MLFRSPEAIAVHMIENMDAKLMMALGACRGEDVAEGNWTEYMKAFSGKLYRPDVAPADVVVAAAAEGADAEKSDGKPAAAPIMRISNPLFETSPAKKNN